MSMESYTRQRVDEVQRQHHDRGAVDGDHLSMHVDDDIVVDRHSALDRHGETERERERERERESG